VTVCVVAAFGAVPAADLRLVGVPVAPPPPSPPPPDVVVPVGVGPTEPDAVASCEEVEVW
jgi:hypothetical protein